MTHKFNTKKGDFFTQYVVNDNFCCGTIEALKDKLKQYDNKDTVKVFKEKCIVLQNNYRDFVYDIIEKEELIKPFTI